MVFNVFLFASLVNISDFLQKYLKILLTLTWILDIIYTSVFEWPSVEKVANPWFQNTTCTSFLFIIWQYYTKKVSWEFHYSMSALWLIRTSTHVLKLISVFCGNSFLDSYCFVWSDGFSLVFWSDCSGCFGYYLWSVWIEGWTGHCWWGWRVCFCVCMNGEVTGCNNSAQMHRG